MPVLGKGQVVDRAAVALFTLQANFVVRGVDLLSVVGRRAACTHTMVSSWHVGKAVPCGLGGPREAVSGCLREAAGAELRRGRALRRGNTAPGICVRSVGDAERTRSYDAEPRL